MFKNQTLIKPKAILFDLDGTLLDTAPTFHYLLSKLATSLNQPAPEFKPLKQAISFGAAKMLQVALNIDENHPKFNEHKTNWLKDYENNLNYKTQYFSGTEDTLNWLLTNNIKYGIVTNKPERYTLPLIKNYPNLDHTQDNISCVISGDTLEKPKPDPNTIFTALEILNVTPKQTWFVGDSLVDLNTAKNANITCILANYGYITDGLNHQHSIDKPLDLIDLIKAARD